MKTSIISVVVGALAICGLIVVEAEGDKTIRGALSSDEDFGAPAEGEHDVSLAAWIAFSMLLVSHPFMYF
jgi:hypothetical protein